MTDKEQNIKIESKSILGEDYEYKIDDKCVITFNKAGTYSVTVSEQMTDKLKVESQNYNIEIDKYSDGNIYLYTENKSGKYCALSLKKHRAVKIINHLIKAFDVSRDEVNL